MKIEAVWKNGCLYFDHFVVVKNSERFYGVYQRNGRGGGKIMDSIVK